MQQVDAGTIVSLRPVGSSVAVPSKYTWDAAGLSLAIQPRSALSEGFYYLDVKADARTLADESLGQSFEFKYQAVAPAHQRRLLGDRVLLAAQGHAASVSYQFSNSAQSSSGDLVVDVYTLPAEIDKDIARLKLQAMNIRIDTLTPEQEKYLNSWESGT